MVHGRSEQLLLLDGTAWPLIKPSADPNGCAMSSLSYVKAAIEGTQR